LSVADRLIEQDPQLLADRNAAGLPGLAGSLVLPQDNRVSGPVDVGDCRPARSTGGRPEIGGEQNEQLIRTWFLKLLRLAVRNAFARLDQRVRSESSTRRFDLNPLWRSSSVGQSSGIIMGSKRISAAKHRVFYENLA
jgi:hypothetical protein